MQFWLFEHSKLHKVNIEFGKNKPRPAGKSYIFKFHALPNYLVVSRQRLEAIAVRVNDRRINLAICRFVSGSMLRKEAIQQQRQ